MFINPIDKSSFKIVAHTIQIKGERERERERLKGYIVSFMLERIKE